MQACFCIAYRRQASLPGIGSKELDSDIQWECNRQRDYMNEFINIVAYLSR